MTSRGTERAEENAEADTQICRQTLLGGEVYKMSATMSITHTNAAVFPPLVVDITRAYIHVPSLPQELKPLLASSQPLPKPYPQSELSLTLNIYFTLKFNYLCNASSPIKEGESLQQDFANRFADYTT